MPKDLFSRQSAHYARYRPSYPKELFQYILPFVEGRDCAWDCATGNGQAAVELALHFRQVIATDISSEQLEHAVPKENIRYALTPAERTSFPDNSFDLITVATAYHWLKPELFFTEATRVGKPGAVVAIWAYNLLRAEEESLNRVIDDLYCNLTGPYWDMERRHVEQSYASVDFRFQPLPSRDFTIRVEWNRDDLLGYLATWSSVQRYEQHLGTSPIPRMEERIRETWPDDSLQSFRFPLFLRMGTVRK
jgi:SAM-dependent methyltransferase